MAQIKLGRHFRFARNKSTLKLKFRLFGLHFFSIVSMSPSVSTVGLTNMLSDGKFVLFADYDSVFLYRVYKEVRMLQAKHGIGSVAIITTGEDVDEQGKEYGNYHVIALGRMKFHELVDALEETSVDRNFLRVPDYFNGRYHVLRVAPKWSGSWQQLRDRPVLKDVLLSSTKRVCSSAIYDFLRVYYGFPELHGIHLPEFDGLKFVRVINYQTTHGGWLSELRRILSLRHGRMNNVLSHGDKIKSVRSEPCAR